MINITLSKQTVILITTLIVLAIGIILGISYYTVSQLVFPTDYVAYGSSQSAICTELRKELLKRPDLTTVTFKNDENMKLAGFLVKRPHATANIIICHGYKGSKEFLYNFIDLFPHWNILLFDFRAHGQSEGNTISVGCHEYKDVIAAAQFIQETTAQEGKLPLVLLGISMGGASIIKAAEAAPNLCNALIVDSTFSSLYRIVLRTFSQKSGLPFYPFFPITKVMFEYLANCNIKDMNPMQSVQKIQQPILFIHSCNDAMSSPINSIKLYDHALNKHTKLWIGPKCRHGMLYSFHPKMYQKKVSSFLQHAAPYITL